MISILEKTTFDSGTFSEQGFWTTKARFARPGIQTYHKSELFGLPGLDNVVGDYVRVIRPENVVFDKTAMESFENVPITIEHENGIVDGDNAKGTVIGAASYPVERAGDTLVVPVTVYDGQAIRDAKTKKRFQLSAGYNADFRYSPGVDKKYGEYDVIMDSWAGNHITITKFSKAGRDFFIGDKSMNEKLKTVKREHKGVSFEFTEQSAQVFDSVCAERDAFKERIKELKGKLDESKKNVMDTDKIENMVNERAVLLNNVAKVAPKVETVDDERKPRSSKAIITDAVKVICPKIDISKKSDDYVKALFDAKIAEVNDTDDGYSDNDGNADSDGDTVEKTKKRAMKTSVKDSESPSDKARREFIEKRSGRN